MLTLPRPIVMLWSRQSRAQLKEEGSVVVFATHKGKSILATETTQQKRDTGQKGDKGAIPPLMMETGESRKDMRVRKAQILTTKAQTSIGTWNVRTLYSTGKLAKVTTKRKIQIDILGVSKMQRTGSGKMMSDGNEVRRNNCLLLRRQERT